MAETRGVPTVLIHTGGVSDVVRSASAAHRLPRLRTISIDISLFGRSRAEIAGVAQSALDALASLVETSR